MADKTKIIGDQLNFGTSNGQIDSDVLPLGTNITHNPTGGTQANLTSTSTARQAIQKVLDLLIDLSGIQDDALVNRHIGPLAVRETEIDLGIDAGDVDADVLPLGTAVTSSPTGGTNTNLANSSFVRAALQEMLNRLIDLSGVQDDAVDSRHIATGAIDSEHIGNDQVDSQHYAAGSIDSEHIGNNQVDSQHYIDDSIDDAHINFGAGADQVSADDLPITDSKGKYVSGNAGGALNEIQATKLSAKVANYTVLDNDGISVINMTTGATNKTVILPTASANPNREILLRKADSGVGKAILDGEGAEPINGTPTWEITEQFGYVKVKSDAMQWSVLAQAGCIYEMWNITDYALTAPWVDYYNLSGLIPGKYYIEYCLHVYVAATSSVYATIATAVDTEDEIKYSTHHVLSNPGYGSLYKSFIRSFNSNTTLYLNAKESGTEGKIMNSIYNSGCIRATRIG